LAVATEVWGNHEVSLQVREEVVEVAADLTQVLEAVDQQVQERQDKDIMALLAYLHLKLLVAEVEQVKLGKVKMAEMVYKVV
jgi:hypothetical protein